MKGRIILHGNYARQREQHVQRPWGLKPGLRWHVEVQEKKVAGVEVGQHAQVTVSACQNAMSDPLASGRIQKLLSSQRIQVNFCSRDCSAVRLEAEAVRCVDLVPPSEMFSFAPPYFLKDSEFVTNI